MCSVERGMSPVSGTCVAIVRNTDGLKCGTQAQGKGHAPTSLPTVLGPNHHPATRVNPPLAADRAALYLRACFCREALADTTHMCDKKKINRQTTLTFASPSTTPVGRRKSDRYEKVPQPECNGKTAKPTKPQAFLSGTNNRRWLRPRAMSCRPTQRGGSAML